MRKITKKTIARIKDGFHDDLMEAIEFLIDTYNEDKFEAGYLSAMEDLSVRSYRLAEAIMSTPKKRVSKGTDAKGKPIYFFETVDDLAKVIEEYFTNALKNK
jgi:hypothetical protein